MSDIKFMRAALLEAEKAKALGEVPVGAVIVKEGVIIARGHNQMETLKDPTAHAECIAIRAACASIGNFRLSGMTLYVTLEPCAMCAGAILNARLDRVVFGAYDPKCGCAGSLYRITEDPAFDHFACADGGVLTDECSSLLRETWTRK